MARCECSPCGEKFGGVTGFDRHQTMDPEGGGVVCHPPAEVGLRLVNGFWVRPYGPDAPGDRDCAA